jgi:hypothetical protein
VAPTKIRQTLQDALQIDPHDNVARNLLEKYVVPPPPERK